jgi:chromosome segregation ATPase
VIRHQPIRWIQRDKQSSRFCTRLLTLVTPGEAAQRLSNRLDAARERITELESDLQSFRDKADRAEQWLGKISMEIEDRLIPQGRRGVGN